eukprot:1597850-Prymnesium_polylepis.1
MAQGGDAFQAEGILWPLSMHLCRPVRVQRHSPPWARGVHQMDELFGISRRFWRRHNRASGMFWVIQQ